MKFFSVYAKTKLPVYSDGSVDFSENCANNNIEEYIVEEWEEDGPIENIKVYKVEDFDKIEKEHQPIEWENFEW